MTRLADRMLVECQQSRVSLIVGQPENDRFLLLRGSLIQEYCG
jgi:hypothetical protein